MGGEEVQQDIGRLKEAVETLKDEVRQSREDIAEMKELLAGMKGGARMLVSVGSIAAALGAGVAEALRWFHGAH